MKELLTLKNFLKDIGKLVQFYKAAAVQSTYLLKRGLSEENFNNYARILITPILYREIILEACLEPSRRSTMEAVQPTYLLKRRLLQRKILIITLEF